jgi:hypothetical protein
MSKKFPIAEVLGMPKKSVLSGKTLTWKQSGGHSGADTIRRIRSNAESNGWVRITDQKQITQLGVTVDGVAYGSPDAKYLLVTFVRYGATQRENVFEAIVKEVER